MTQNQEWGQKTPVVEASDEDVKFLETLAQKLNQDGEALVQTSEDTETTPEAA